MALTPTQTWTDTAAAGTANPVVLVELKPTILYDDKRLSDDWQGGEDTSGTSLRTSTVSGLNQVAPEDGDNLVPYPNEVRLGDAEVTHPDKQEATADLWYAKGLRFYCAPTIDYDTMPQFIQTFKSEKAFRLKKLYIGLPRDVYYKGNTIVRIYTHLSEPGYRFWVPQPGLGVPISSAKGTTLATKGLLDNARQVAHIDISHNGDDNNTFDGVWRELDLSEENIWLPGGDILCAIGLHVTEATNAEHLHLFGSDNGANYTRGQLLEHEHSTGRSYKIDGDLAFKMIGDGFESTGAGVWEFDLAESLSGYTSTQKAAEVAKRISEASGGTLEIADCQPPGTSIKYEMRESLSTSFSGSWKIVSDGAALGDKRYIQVKATLTGDSGQLDTPRIFSIRAAYQRSEKFATRPVLGYSNALMEVPDFSVEGDPLEGVAKSTDTSKIVLSTAEGMITRLFQLYPMKNDEVVVKLGFDTSSFAETDYLPLKHLRVEGWTVKANHVVLKCYDGQVKLKEIQVPGETDPPEKTEKIYYVKQTPDVILKDLLKRARVRDSKIKHASFTTLASSLNWQLSKEIIEPTKLNELTSEINKHLLAFMAINESGRWQVHSADFSASPTVEIEESEILEGSEETDLGIEAIRNETVVLYNPAGGEAQNETDYQNVTIEYDGTSQKANQETIADKLISTVIPPDTDSNDPDSPPRLIAHRRLTLQKDGLRVTRWSTTGVKYAFLQVGDHVGLNSQYYRRAGVSTYNPLVVMITRKQIDANLNAVHWSGIILLDADQSAGSPTTIAAPTGFSVTNGADGTATWAWTKSTDDDGTNIRHYELLQTVAGVAGFSRVKTLIAADGSASYSYPDSDFTELVEYDFAVRAVHISGRKSALATDTGVTLTASAPDQPATADLRVRFISGGSYEFSIEDEASGAHHYNVYVHWDTNVGWFMVGKIPAGADNNNPLVFRPPDPEGTVVYGGTIIFKHSVVNAYGMESDASDGIGVTWRPTVSGGLTAASFTAPTLVSAGGYPIVNWTANGPYGSWSITIKITPATADLDAVDRYEVQRRDDGGTSKASWNDWQKLADKEIQRNFESDEIQARTYLYVNKDSNLKAGYYYQYRVRSIGETGAASSWSTAQEVLISEDTTGPDQPTIAVTSVALANWIVISTPAQSGGSCPDFSHFKIEGNPAGAGWQTLAAQWPTTNYTHKVPLSGITTSWAYRVTAYDHSGNASTVSAASSGDSPELITTSGVAFTVVGTGNIVGTINSSSEGIDISAAKIAISGSTTFSSGYNPTAKLDHTGGAYNSAGSGARVRIFPDSNTGILVTDGTNDVFKVLVGGTDVGDVIIGPTSGEYIKWDKSAGTLRIKGLLDTALGESISDQNRVRVGEISGVAQLALMGGGVDSGYFKAVSAGTGYGESEIWMKRTAQVANSDAEMTLNPRLLSFTFNSTELFRIDNNSALGSKADFKGMEIDAGKGINITGLLTSPMTYLALNGTAVLDGQISGTGLNASGNPSTLSDAVTKTDFNALLTAIRAVSLMSAN